MSTRENIGLIARAPSKQYRTAQFIYGNFFFQKLTLAGNVYEKIIPSMIYIVHI